MEQVVIAVMGLLATVLAAIIPLVWKDLSLGVKRRFSRSPESVAELHRIEVFQTRNSSDALMIKDISVSEYVYFFGVSHSNLKLYLESVLSELTASGHKLKGVDVCFASEADGTLWEGKNFNINVIHARQQIAELIASQEWERSTISKIRFLQSAHHTTYGGCLIEKVDGEQVAYVANYLPTPQPNAKDSLTFRFQSNKSGSPQSKNLSKKYINGFKHILARARDLGEFRPSVWDHSVSEWTAFARACNAHRESMEELCRFLHIKPQSNVLDVACADGTTSKILFDHLVQNGSRLTVLDASPQLLANARSMLPDNVIFSLRTVPHTNIGLNDFVPPYDVIIIHLALTNIATDYLSLKLLSNWCKNSLMPNGMLVIAAHNTSVRITDSNYNMSVDMLRNAIREEFGTDPARLRNNVLAHSFDPNEIESTFMESGFQLQKTDTKRYKISMHDRILMWSTPAVLDSIIDVGKTTPAERNNCMQKISNQLLAIPTPDMVVQYWLWQPLPQVVS